MFHPSYPPPNLEGCSQKKSPRASDTTSDPECGEDSHEIRVSHVYMGAVHAPFCTLFAFLEPFTWFLMSASLVSARLCFLQIRIYLRVSHFPEPLTLYAQVPCAPGSCSFWKSTSIDAGSHYKVTGHSFSNNAYTGVSLGVN